MEFVNIVFSPLPAGPRIRVIKIEEIKPIMVLIT